MTTRFVTNLHFKELYAIFLTTIDGIGYLFCIYNGNVETICPCCMLNTHRMRIARAITEETANGNIRAGEKVRWAFAQKSQNVEPYDIITSEDPVGGNGGGILERASFCGILPEDVPGVAKEEALALAAA